MTDDTYRNTLLATARDARVREVTEYTVNIENFERAIARIEPGSDLSEFRTQLESLLAATRYERAKALIMLAVIEDQLNVD